MKWFNHKAKEEDTVSQLATYQLITYLNTENAKSYSIFYDIIQAVYKKDYVCEIINSNKGVTFALYKNENETLEKTSKISKTSKTSSFNVLFARIVLKPGILAHLVFESITGNKVTETYSISIGANSIIGNSFNLDLYKCYLELKQIFKK